MLAYQYVPTTYAATEPEKTLPVPAWINPDLERLFMVRHDPGNFRAWAQSLVDLPAGSVFARINGVTTAEPAYTSIQIAPNKHVEFNSDLKFINHSCDPSLELDTERMEFRVASGKPLRKGDVLSFFYPSSEWDMIQPFECWCKAGNDKCFGQIAGAKNMDPMRLAEYHLNAHIKKLLSELQIQGKPTPEK
ncbi:hypothetical protein F5B22DRAFT_640403 [Xylaria bambusicola]|uniref:uncharacterized protein n=1 Tax=Xylaria bambusicola TaxID=326684 RepID=UPI0020077BC1|nr:uncharacterized protein F5B22DRAFT_640403 [Xylaria bambusicola]KAI0503100.1 hypothetical protein F5B22DRAFT_640403 [Xylaria bambusicola]